VSATLWFYLQRRCKTFFVSVFINLRFADSVCLYCGLRVCGLKYIVNIIIIGISGKTSVLIVDVKPLETDDPETKFPLKSYAVHLDIVLLQYTVKGVIFLNKYLRIPDNNGISYTCPNFNFS